MNRTLMRQRDRFSYSAGMTLSLGPKTYEFFKFEVGLSSDCMKGESLQSCVDRVVGEVEKAFNQKLEEFEKGQSKKKK